MARDSNTLEVNQHFLSNVANNQPDTFGISLQKPKFPQYAVVSKRMESFKTWPAYLPLKPDCMIEAGLVYTGVGDSVRCYHCGGGLRNWEEEDKPWEEHAKWYPTCPHVLLVKGQKYVDALTRGEKPDEDGAKNEVKLETSTEDHMNSAAALSCVQMGFSEGLVKQAINAFLKNNNGKATFKGEDLCMLCFKLEESVDNIATQTSIPSSTTQPEVAACSNVLDSVQTSSTRSSESGVLDCDQAASDLSEINSEDLTELLSENTRLKENQMCKICLDDVANVIFLPCGHMVSCPQCAPALNKCPICRDSVKGYVKAYFGTVDEKN